MKFSTSLLLNIATVLFVLVGAGMLYLLAIQIGDPTPDSVIGYSFAFAGTGFMLQAAIRYTLYRRSRKRGMGKLNGSLNWHIIFAIMALILLFMHAFGNFNPRSGTYALYGMVAMVISGFVGRFFDRLLPRLITREVAQALTRQGEDRIETISHDVQSIVTHHLQQIHATKVVASTKPEPVGLKKLQGSWDLAYISLEETPQEIQYDTVQYRFVPDRKSKLASPEALMPGVQQNMDQLQDIERAHRREKLCRYIIRYWRVLHISLAILTIGLTVYHVEYALQLLIPVWLHR